MCILGHAFALHTAELFSCHFNSVHDRTKGRRQCVAWHNISLLIDQMLMEALLILWTCMEEKYCPDSECLNGVTGTEIILNHYEIICSALILQHHNEGQCATSSEGCALRSSLHGTDNSREIHNLS